MEEKVRHDSLWTDLRHFFHHLSLKIGRKGFLILLFIALFGGAALGGWKTGFWARIYRGYNQAAIMVVVEDSQTGRLLLGVPVEADGQVLETDEGGKVFFEELPAREVTFKVSLPGFKDFFQTVRLKRGPNKELVFSLQIATSEVVGEATDYVDGAPIAEAKVAAPGGQTTTGKDGKFVLEEVIVGTPEITISKDGYFEFRQTVELSKNVVEEMGEIKLLAKGRVVFVSNRDGKNAIYWAKLDGSGLGKTWENKAGFDDTTPYLSPDKQKIIFLSNRDNQKGEYGDIQYFLYYNDTSGESLQKISFDTGLRLRGWLADGSGFVYETYSRSEGEGWQRKILPLAYAAMWPTYGEIKIVKVPTLTVSTLVKDSGFKVGDDYVEMRLLALSPKSDWIAFNVENYDVPDKTGVYLIHPDGTGRRRISTYAAASYWEGGGTVGFSEDGKKVFYEQWREGKRVCYSYDIASDKETKISTCPADRVGVYSSAQKLKAFIDYRDGKSDVYLSKKDGTSERRVTSAGGVQEVYFAGPNDRYLVYSVSREQESALYVVGLKRGSKPLKITDISSGFAGVVPE